MTKSYFNLLLWVVTGSVLGFIVYSAFFAPPPAIISQPTNAPLLNATNPAPIVTAPSVVDADVIVINPKNCALCNSSSELLEQLKTQGSLFNLRIIGSQAFDVDSAQGQELISKYKITKLPSLILTAKDKKPINDSFVSLWQQKIGTLESDGSLVFRELPFPYYSITSSSVVGLVEGIAIRPGGCENCFDPSILFRSLEAQQMNMVFSNITYLDQNDSRAKELISKYNITKIPALLLSKGANDYDLFNQKVLPLGEFSGDWFILRSAFPPYIDLADNSSVRGLVSSIEITNSSCVSCLNISGLSDYISSSSGVVIVNSTKLEANSSAARSLISKYEIKYLPTFLYSPDASVYPGFDPAWLDTNSTVEKDGWHIFRAQPSLNMTYQNVSG
ncbi:hypothetical protein HY988_05495 [Candidatus Micrarchaeota archaeon]|nr:hypothetical protein [Candidatus Micrarchaeota archaeon]